LAPVKPPPAMRQFQQTCPGRVWRLSIVIKTPAQSCPALLRAHVISENLMRCTGSIPLATLAAWGLLACGQSVAAQETAPAASSATERVLLDEPPSPPLPTVAAEGPIREPYEDGSVRVERTVRRMSDDSIVNHGQFTEYYKNGQKFAEGAYNNGVMEGPWSYWHENGQLGKTVTFKNGQPDGSWESFRADGTLLSKRTYKDGKREGHWVTYYADGKTLQAEQHFADGKLNGTMTVYFKSGKPRIATEFKDDKRHGAVTEWDESGRKVAEATYVDNQLDGKLTRYSPDGSSTVEMYSKGKRVPNEGAGA
jgi:antitoxin component YwqK of YwqJK toxin-antitoxin module